MLTVQNHGGNLIMKSNSLAQNQFQSSIRPHLTIVFCTISGWLKKTLKQAGINTNLFRTHSEALLHKIKPVWVVQL